MTYHKEV
jgi:hypothetical protein